MELDPDPNESYQGLFRLNIPQLGEIIKLGIPLEGVYIVEALIEGTNPKLHIPSARLEGIYQTLIRKGYLGTNNEITLQGKELYHSLLSGAGKTVQNIKQIKKDQETLFMKWWNIFPPNSGFTYEGRVFSRTRALRQGKESCQELFTRILNTADYTGEQIIEATKAHVETLKRNSVKEGKNNLHYLQNSLTYLRNRTFEAFMNEQPELQSSSQTINIDI